jgi:hypothetical protein
MASQSPSTTTSASPTPSVEAELIAYDLHTFTIQARDSEESKRLLEILKSAGVKIPAHTVFPWPQT